MSTLLNNGFSPVHALLIASVFLAVIIVELAYTVFAPSDTGRKRINRRMSSKNSGNNISQKAILLQLRKERGLDHDGRFVLSAKWLNRMIVQSGFTIGLKNLAIIYGLYFVLSSLGILYLTRSPITAIAVLPLTMIGIPLLFLRIRRGRKLNKFGSQLPEAIDLICRSLKAGHPVPVAISMVAQEMPDPVGTEFGMVSDEVTYGSDLVTALNNLYDRVGHSDLPLLISSVSIQSTTGGNLREILEGLSSVIRDRQKMKRKVRAISAEGRLSAIFLSALPFVLFGALLFMTPDYYSDIWDEDLTYWLVSALGVWLVLGNLLIFKMVKFKV